MLTFWVYIMNKMAVSLLLLGVFSSGLVLANDEEPLTPTEELDKLKEQVNYLETVIDQRLNMMADSIEENQAAAPAKASGGVHIGGYGEMHYNNLDQDGEKLRELDFHRMVLFFSHDFNERARFFTEFEIEHIIAGGGNRGAVELEQAYVEIDLKPNMQLQTGAMLMPIGIINETHEPTTFYGVERPIIETTIIPTTWWSGGMKFEHLLDSGLRYHVMVSEGFKTQDPNSDPAAEPFNLKSGKQKTSFASAFDLAITATVSYTGIRGLELAAYSQYQPDLDQSAEVSYADSATLLGGHVIYRMGNFTTRALYARWDLAGDLAADAGKDVQDGGYIEVSWKANEHWGVFVRGSNWSQQADNNSQQTDIGINYYPFEDIVFKADYQIQNEDAGKTNGFNLGFGYQF